MKRGAATAHDRLRSSPEAFTDIDEIAIYVGQDSPDAAHRVVDEIYRAIRGLVPFPHQGYRRPDLTNRPLRFIRVRDYLIAYVPDEKPLWVVAVMHGHRSPRVMYCERRREG